MFRGEPRSTLSQSPGQPNLTTPIAPAPVADGSRAKGFANGALVDGKYLVEETVAEGGIGVIVVARHLALNQRVAIKYLKPKALGNPMLVERFVREGRLAAQIASDHVVRVYDVGTLAEGGPYMVMEYLVGQDLGSLLQSGTLSVERAVDYVIQACDALAEAHVLRIVHRDIKPENLFLTERPSNTPILKIIDFGISKVAPSRGEDGRWGHETAASERFGTPLYMSPEHLRSSADVDSRTDIWSLGVTLYELMTGQLPFVGNDLPQLCTSVLASRPIHLRAVLPDASPLLEAVLLKCLEKDPDLRYDDVAGLAEELAPFGPPSAGARVARIKDVMRRGGQSVRRRSRTPSTSEIRPLALEVARALAGEASAITSVGLRAPSPSRRGVAIAGVAALGCIAALAYAQLGRSFPAARSGRMDLAVLPSAPTRAPSEAIIAPTTSPGSAPEEPAAVGVLSPDAPAAPSTPDAPAAPSATVVARATVASPSASRAPSVRPLPPTQKRRELFGSRE
jgi:eukaryotic-like serine/threonine-protein kinase